MRQTSAPHTSDGHAGPRTIALMLGLTMTGILGLACGLCVSEEQLRVASPDGQLVAVLFQHDCGATTDFSSQVSVLPTGASLRNQAGNVFISDADHDRAPRASWGGPPVALRWRGPRELVVTYHPLARVFLEEQKIEVRTGWFSSVSVSVEFVHDSDVGLGNREHG